MNVIDQSDDIIDIPNNDEETEEAEETKEAPPEKPKETPQEKKARLERQLKRVNKELGIEPEKKEVKAEKKEGLDRIDRTVLRMEKITEPEEIELVEAIMKESGKDVEGVIASKYFQSELKEMREARTTEEATPKGSKRSNQSPKDDVAYWIAKGELPPADQVELRRKVVNTKMKVEKDKSQFSDISVIS